MPLLQEGEKIKGTYEVERFLGEGAFAEVYRVRHRFLGRQAMKLFKRVGMTQDEIEEMLGEAILLSRIGHPNIVRVFDANIFETPNGIRGYFTMENVSGGSLDKFWRSFGANLIPIETTLDIMRQICRGLAVAHNEKPPIIHRDIKPQNILIGYEADGLRARVSDFGLAKKVNPMTLLATAAGTLGFKPPETFSKAKADSCAGDVWALGVTLYLMLTNRLPYEVDPALGWSNKKAFEKECVLPASLNMDVDAGLEKIVLRCLEMDPAKRYQNAKELLDVLGMWKKPSPSKESVPKKTGSSESKASLGAHSPVNQEEGQRLARLAIKKAKDEGRLFEAADIMEEAFNKSPSLREKYANQVRL
ncbi:MAG: serine/threonine protein kinase [Deltaproteobacteria bacterium]|nr:serine/threonine protein kinase [Deltaproteobacteria bacterium]